jgi:hypothetical protein
MRIRTGLVLAVLFLAGACGQSAPPNDDATKDASPAATESVEPAKTLETTVIEPGKVGAFVVGMPASQALDQGLVTQPAEDPPCPAFAATEPLQDVAVVFSAAEAKPKLLGVLVKIPGPKTPEGIGVGSTIADLKAAYGDQLRLEDGDYGDKIYRVYEGERAMGFASSRGTKPSMKIDAIEVFAKSDPVIWDGC